MFYREQSEDYRPLFWVQGRAIYANTLLVIAHVFALAVCGICIAYLDFGVVSNALALFPSAVWHGQVWRPLSYVALDPSFFTNGGPFWFLWSMAILYFCGREVEQFVGRRAYLGLYAALVLVPAILFFLLGPVLGLGEGSVLSGRGAALGCGEALFGVFVAFATIYPGAMPSMWLTIPVWVLAWIFLGLYTLLDFAFHNYTTMFMLWTSSAVGYLGMRFVGAGRGFNWLTDWIDDRRTARLARKRNIRVVTERRQAESIDAILDKISKHGVGSLNAQERAALERARTKLIDRDGR